MKIIKDTKTSLLLKSFLLDNKDYLSITVLCYFDLDNPDLFLEEQSMFRESFKELDKTMLDYAMPKPNAEVLLCGYCHNLLENTDASHVKLEVGEIDKELFVFGEREWSMGGITEPKPLKKIPLTYEYAKAKDNFLPNIEDPKNLITTKDEVIIPAGFMPKDINSKTNRKKLGTYDEKYKRDLWPGFASDMDYSFFNLAPNDQQIDSFFKGGETIQLTNMHPKEHIITSKIPETYIRCFATKRDKDSEEIFEEVKLKRDTLWLFPEIKRGIIIFRGTLEVADEIYSNIKNLNLKPVEQDAQSKSLEVYYEEQKKELDRSVELDETPFKEAEAKVKEAKKEVFDIPRQVKEGIEKTQGKRPSLRRTPSEKIEMHHKQIDESLARIEKSKAKFYEMKDKFGHISKIDISSLDKAKEELLASKVKMAEAMKQAEKQMADAEVLKKEALDKINEIKNDPKIPDEKKEKIDTSFFEPHENFWSDYAFEFLTKTVKTLEKKPEELHKLRHLGLAKRTIPRAWIGYNLEDKTLQAREWNLESKELIELPKGLVTARFEEATLKSLKINDILVTGSDAEYELFLSEENYTYPLFYLKDDLEAYLCDQELYDICNTLVCNDISSISSEKPKEAVEKASIIFYAKKDGVVEKLENAREFDYKEYKNLFELYQNGVDIREQFIKNLPKEIQEELPIKRDISVKTLMEKSKKITNKVKYDLKAKGEALKAEMEKQRDEELAKANELLKKKGLDPIRLEEHTPSGGFIKASEVSDEFDKAIKTLKEKEAQSGLNITDKIAELQKAKEEMVSLAVKGEKQYKEGMAKIAEVKEKAKDPIPQWAKDMMLKAGIDPDNPHPPKLTREMVVELHKEGKSFKTKDLSELDLSKLDLSGIDLTQANCSETNFQGSNLKGAKLKQTNCIKTDFSSANLSEAEAFQTIFKESVLNKTLCEDLKINGALFEKLEIQSSTFTNAYCENIVFKESVINDTTFEGAKLINPSFIKSSLKRSSFDNSKIEGMLLSESIMESCYLLNIDAKKMLFNKSHLLECDFSHSRLYNTRILKESTLKKCSLTHCNMESSSIFEATLSDCNLQKSFLSKSLIKKSDIEECDFRGVVAKQARFEYSEFKNCSLRGIDLLRGSLRGVDMKRCDFSKSNLYAVEMYKTKLFEVNFNGANLKRSSLENRVEFIGKPDDKS